MFNILKIKAYNLKDLLVFRNLSIWKFLKYNKNIKFKNFGFEIQTIKNYNI